MLQKGGGSIFSHSCQYVSSSMEAQFVPDLLVLYGSRVVRRVDNNPEVRSSKDQG